MTPPEQRSVERHFWLVRDEDVSGVSGTGRVAEAFVFEDGTAALRWLTQHRSTAIYASLDELDVIHGHHGSTRLVPATEPAAPDTEAGHWEIDSYGERHWIDEAAQAGPPPLEGSEQRHDYECERPDGMTHSDCTCWCHYEGSEQR